MEATNYKVVGLDASRPPVIQPRPCIDLIFELNEEAPRAWCEEFQAGVGKQPFSITIDPDVGLHIETWVRTPAQIEKALETVKSLVLQANEAYLLRLKRERQLVDADDDVDIVVSPEQSRLDAVVAGLNFDT